MSNGRRILYLLMFYGALLIGIFSSAQMAEAQGTAQITIIGAPPVLSSPVLADQVRNYEQGRYPIRFIYTSPNSRPVSFVFRATLTFNGALLFDITSEPTSFRPGIYTYLRLNDPPAIRFRESIGDLINQLSGELRTRVVTSGKLPEGSYRLTIEPVPQENFFISTLPGTSFFRVQYAQPPSLFTPADGGFVTQAYPVFSWTPEAGRPGSLMEYELLLVEVAAHQTPLQAIQGNRAWETVAVQQQTSFVYGPQQLPLQEGATYAWQITARDLNKRTPISDEGETRIFTFTYNPSGTTDELAFAERIWLVPGLAYLTERSSYRSGFGRFRSAPDRWGMDNSFPGQGSSPFPGGAATLVFEMAGMPIEIPVDVSSLQVQPGSGQDAIVTGGSVRSILRNIKLPLGDAGEFASIRELTWSYGEGFILDGTILLPNARRVRASGTLDISMGGISGSLIAESQKIEIGAGPVTLSASRIEADFPAGNLRANVTVSLFGEGSACGIQNLRLDALDAPSFVSCNVEEQVSLFGNSDRLTLDFSQVNGTIAADIRSGDLAYELNIPGRLSLATAEGSACEIMAPLTLSSSTGVQIGEVIPSCATGAVLDLGIIRAEIDELAIDELSFDNGNWATALDFGARLSLPDLGLSLPDMQGIRLDGQGIHFPAHTFDPALQAVPTSLRSFEIAGYTATVNSFTLPETSFPWFGWKGDGAGPWEFSLGAEVTIPADSRAPSCLRNASIQASELLFKNGALSGTLQAEDLGECRWEFGGGYALNISELGGSLTANGITNADFIGESAVTLDATLELGAPFQCGAQSRGAVQLLSESLRLYGDGRLEGSIPNILPQCPIAVGPFTAAATRSELAFKYSQNPGQHANLDLDASLQLPDGTGADGSLSVDLISGELTALDFKLLQPFQWNIPQENPVLSFTISEAAIDLDGFSINGRNELVFENGTTLGATFDRLRLDHESLAIEEGAIIFDGAFGFVAGIDPTGSDLIFRAVPSGHILESESGALFELAGEVRIDTLGLHASGSAAASLKYGSWKPQSPLEVDFSDDFLMEIYPFGIRRGQADLLYKDVRFAYLDATGFHAGPGLLTSVLPERLPLPNEQVAYLQIKNGDQPVITLSDTLDGMFKVETRPGQTLELVVPALQHNGVTPAINAILDDLVVSRGAGGDLDYVSGRVTAVVSGSPIDLDGTNIPIRLQELTYGQFDDGQGGMIMGLFAGGALKLMGKDVGEVVVKLDANRAVGYVDLPDLNQTLELAGSAGQLVLDVNSVAGLIDVPYAGQPDTELEVTGAIGLNDTDGNELVRAEIGLAISPASASITHFTPTTSIEPTMLDLGAVRLAFTGIESLPSFTYNDQTGGFDFSIGLGLSIALEVPGGDLLTIPLNDVLLSPGGFMLPAQQVNKGNDPASFDETQSITLGPLEMNLFDALLAHNVTINWLNDPGSILDALAGLQLSFGLTFPEYAPIEQVTLSGAGFEGGIFTGNLAAYNYLEGTEPRISLGGDLGLRVRRVSGALTNENGSQGMEVSFEGEFDLPSYLQPLSGECENPAVSIDLGGDGPMEGEFSNIAGCARFAYGPATIAFPTSNLLLTSDGQGNQQAVLEAQANAEISGVNEQVTGNGAIEIDLMTGDILDANIVFNGAFDYGLPAEEPVFTFRIQEAAITGDGLLIDGSGAFMPGGVNAGVEFSQFTINPLTPAIAGGSAVIQSGFALELQLSGEPNWQVVPTEAAVSDGAALRLDMSSGLMLDSDGLTIDGASIASFNYDGDTYASLTADFRDFRLGVEPAFGVKSGRVDFVYNNAMIGYYDGDFYYDAEGMALAAVLPRKIPLPTIDVAYLKIKDEQGNLLVGYESLQNGGYRLNSADNDDDGEPDPLELIVAGLGDGQEDQTVAQVTFSSLTLDENYAVTDGSIDAAIDLNLLDRFDIPVRLTRIYFRKDGETGAYSLTADGNADLPQGLAGGQEIVFTDLGITEGGLTGTVTAGATPFVGQCGQAGAYDPQAPVASVAYTSGELTMQPSLQAIENADLAINLRAVQLVFDPAGSNAFTLLGDVSSRLTAEPDAQAPDRILFIGSYDDGVWTAGVCTDILPDDDQGENKISIATADLYLGEDNGGSAALEINTNTGSVDLVLSGMLAVPAFGGGFAATISNLRMGSSGISVESAGGQMDDQELTLFSGNVKVFNDQLALAWNPDTDALDLSLSGELWIVPFQCEGDPNSCLPGEGVSLANLTVNTRGDVDLGAMSANLLTDAIVVIGSEEDPILSIGELALEKRPSDILLSIMIGGMIRPGELMDGASAEFDFRLFADGSIEGGPVSVPFGDGSNRIGDNANTEFAFGSFAVMDVKEIGLTFDGGHLSHPAVFANGAVYVTPEDDAPENVIAFGAQGQSTAGGAGFYYALGAAPVLSLDSEVTLPDVDLGVVSVKNVQVGLTTSSRNLTAISLGGDLSLNVPDAVTVSISWRDVVFDREGIDDPGGIGAGGNSIDISDIVTLNVGNIDIALGGGELTLVDSYDEEGNPVTTTIETDGHLMMSGLNLTVSDLGGGGVEEAFFYTAGETVRLSIQNAHLTIGASFAANLTLDYTREAGGDFALMAAGGMDLNGLGAVGLAGALANVNGEVAMGLAFSLEAAQGIPILPPNIVTLTGINGGFFYNPTVAMMELALGQCGGGGGVLPAFDNIPQEYRFDHCNSTAVDNIDVAAFLGAQARVIDAGGGTSLVAAQALLSFKTGNEGQAIALAVEGEVLGRESMSGAFALNLVLGDTRSEINGYAGIIIDESPLASGDLEVNLFAVKQANQDLVWAVSGNASVDLALGSLTGNGDFLVSNDGMLLHLGVATGVDVWVVAIEADMEMDAWLVTGTDNFGAYFAVDVNASLFGGAAELGAEVKGAYINRESLFYGAATGYVQVAGVFDGAVTIWLAIEDGEFDAGKGSDARFDRMIADARADAEDMMDAAEGARDAMADAEQAAFDLAVEKAGLQLVSANAGARAGYAEALLGNEEALHQQLNSGVPAIFQQIADDVITGNRPSFGGDTGSERQAIADQIQDLQEKAAAVSGHLGSLTAQAIEWDAEAAQLSQTLSSPVSGISAGSFSGSGENKSIEAAPSFTINESQAQLQEEALADLKTNVDALDQQYKDAIAAVSVNLGKLGDIMSGQTVFEEIETSYYTATYTTTVNEVASGYSQVRESIESFFSTRADSLWRTRDWVNEKLISFGAQGDYSYNSVQSALNDQISDYTSAEEHIHATALGINRCHQINQLADNSGNAEDFFQSCEDDFDTYYDEGDWSALAGHFRDSGLDLWYNAPRNGLEEYATILSSEAEGTRVEMDEVLAPVQAGALSLTQSVNYLYAVKAGIGTTLYGMLEKYLDFRRGTFGAPDQDVGRAAFEQQRTELLAMLRPPTILAVKVARWQGDYRSAARFTYPTQHPDGIAEVSYSILRGSTSEAAQSSHSNFYTTGVPEKLVVHVFKEERSQMTEDISVALRVRGPGGATTTRRVSVPLTVDVNGPSTTAYMGNQLEDDTSPPMLIAAYLPYGAPAEVAEGSSVQQPASQGYAEAYWTSNNSQLNYNITAIDQESDISKYEYAIGTSQGATDVKDWSEGVGTKPLAGENVGAANAVFRGIAQGLNLEAAVPYYVSIRVTNGDGLSTEEELDTPLVFDATAPGVPGRVSEGEITSREPEQNGQMERSSDLAVTIAPAYEGPPSFQRSAYTPMATVTWQKASDMESGISDYQYVVTDDAATAQEAFADEGNIQTTDDPYDNLYSFDGLSYFTPSYVYVRAVNHAGAAGEALRIGPIVPVDPDGPQPAQFRVQVMLDGIRVYLTHPAYDQESSIAGYQYAVYSDNGVVRERPSAAFDFDPHCATSAPGDGSDELDTTGCGETYIGASAPYFFIPGDDLPQGEELYIRLYAVNYQGLWSETRSKGEVFDGTFIVLDDTDPPNPDIGDYSYGAGDVTFDLEDVYDPESGIVKVEWAIRGRIVGDFNSPDYNTLTGTSDWHELITYTYYPRTEPQTYLSETESWDAGTDVGDGGRIELGIRVTNSVGLQTVVWDSGLLATEPESDEAEQDPLPLYYDTPMLYVLTN